MSESRLVIRPYTTGDQASVTDLWKKCGLTRDWNNPEADIKRKLKVNPELFIVGTVNSLVVATGMGGYDGHRGWVHYLGVDPAFQRRGFGKLIMESIEKELLKSGCPKLNLQIRDDNREVIAFYEAIGYDIERRVSMGKRLIPG